ncbi:uncharacterized protein isoform X4 [Salmo salar]|uniref:Uncharacterized protein isoform X4 n=1 Tax=Salmo salar TaxID=8030 RepID=A0A1S3SJQ4_SALSA|nr:uncharacterized protein LOC106610002 isoform X4 [Salmo salar]|eukprot:XP_014064568.1 PREDICTED: uncharacterized protein LOC106610002 isoform X4 [Salmo salar]
MALLQPVMSVHRRGSELENDVGGVTEDSGKRWILEVWYQKCPDPVCKSFRYSSTRWLTLKWLPITPGHLRQLQWMRRTRRI